MNHSRAPSAIALTSATSKELNALTEPLRDRRSVFLILDLLAADIDAHPEKLRAVDAAMVTRIASLIPGVDVDLNAPLLAEDE